MTIPVFPIIPTTQQYDWGKIGLSSQVAQFASASQVSGFTLDENAPYAELWMGTHPKSPSRVLKSRTVLADYLATNPSLMGRDVIQRFDASDGNIPFLFKVLSIEKALSIQTHPDKKMAERLHAEQPDIYKDPNHKPEMAIAITPFTALCGFMPLPLIAAFLSSTPEFAALIPSTIVSHFLTIASSPTPNGPAEKAALRDVFSALMTADETTIKIELAKLIARYRKGEVAEPETAVKDLVLRLDEQFPGDIGVFCAFMLNYVKMQPGDAIFLGAGEPHAYVSGDIMECMATSDNVIRAGLTPKLRDVPNLISGLTYIASDPSKHIVKPQPFRSSSTSITMLYDPPVPEFSVLQIKIPAGAHEAQEAVQGPSLLIVTGGQGKVTWDGEGGEIGEDLSIGKVLFVGAGIPLRFGTEDGIHAFRAFVEAPDHE